MGGDFQIKTGSRRQRRRIFRDAFLYWQSESLSIHGNGSMHLLSKQVAALLIASALAGCAPMTQTTADTAWATRIPQIQLDANGHYKDWGQVIRHDQAMVARGLAPPIVLQYDAQASKLPPGTPQSEAILRAKLAATEKFARDNHLDRDTPQPEDLFGTTQYEKDYARAHQQQKLCTNLATGGADLCN
jgi:hypothetical protein